MADRVELILLTPENLRDLSLGRAVTISCFDLRGGIAESERQPSLHVELVVMGDYDDEEE